MEICTLWISAVMRSFITVTLHEVIALERLLQDIRYGARSLRKSPQFAIAAVLTLALGIGANTAMFSIVRAVLLRPWPFPNARRLLLVSQRQEDGSSNLFSTRDFLEWKKQGGLLSGMGAHVSWKFNLNAPGTEPERIPGAEISSDWLPILGVEPMLGRFFSSQEDTAGAGNFVILSRAVWQNRYGANRNIVGNASCLLVARSSCHGNRPDDCVAL